CGPTCLNRCSMTECNESTCSIGTDCTNRMITNLQPEKVYEALEILEISYQGYGLASKVDLPGESIVIEYTGEVIVESEKQRRWAEYKDKQLYYVMSLTEGFYIDATAKGNWARFVNHSCNPNCVVKRMIVDRKPRIALETIKAISAGDQITIAYDFDPTYNPQGCLCGEPNCFGIIGYRGQKKKGG
ncbi:hypothetical protein BKA56DRAFT_496471, partial [Ilyonectria sp. MPI-CAGE-AT-0026]